MTLNTTRSTFALSALCAAVLTACGGGSSSDTPPVTPSSVRISGTAVDGPLLGATACYDLNDNGACDSGEPSSTTDANGAFALDVDAAAAGLHRVVVAVPASAVDKDTGQAVGTAFTLQSPATGTTTAHTVFASPLTTLVQLHMDATGATLNDASDDVRAQAGLAVSPLADYTQSDSADAQQAATVARLVTLTQQQQSAAIASVVGQVDIAGQTVTNADVQSASARAVFEALPALAAAAQDPAVTGAATPSERDAALAAAAQTLVSEHTGLGADTALAVIGMAHMPADVAPATTDASASLRMLTYSDAHTWFYRALEASAADNTPDADGKQHFYDVRKQSALDVFGKPLVTAWAFGTSPQRAGDLHWNGSAWVSCPLGSRNESTARDPHGRSRYNYCDHFEDGSSQRSALDLNGKTLRSVVADKVRNFPASEAGVAYAKFGPDNLDLWGSAAFDQGATLWYYRNHPLQTAFAYDVQPTNIVKLFPAAIAAGGDTRSTSGLACATVTGANSASLQTAAATLEDLIARNPGTPCVFAQAHTSDGSSLVPNEWWSNSTLSLGTVAGAAVQPAGTGSYYTTTASLRVGFTAGSNATSYYRCLQRKADGSPRNCTPLGTGTYSIATLGDARVLTFKGLPALTQRAGFTRIFVERGGAVYYGYKNPVGGEKDYLAFNLKAANELLAQLGLQAITPIPPASAADAAKAALFASAKGTWTDASGAIVFRFGDGGSFVMAKSTAGGPNEQPGVERGTLDIDPVTGVYASLLAVDSNGESGVSHPGASDRITSVTATALTTSNTTLTRLANDPNGIVGLWAVDSPSDLAAVQVAFFADGHVILIDGTGATDVTDACFTEHQGPPGIERASYTFNAGTGALHVFDKQVDTNGCGGLFDSSQGAILNGTANTVADLVLTFASDKMSATTNTGATLYRIAPQ